MKRSTRKRIVALGSLAAAAIVILVIVSPYLFAGAPSDVTIRIPRNADTAILTDTLHKYLGDDFGDRTMRLVGTAHVDLAGRYGAYRVEKGESPATVAKRLTRGMQTPVKITINGFRTPEVMAGRIARKMDFTAEQLLAAINDSALLAKYGLPPGHGFELFIDDTYEAYWTDTPTQFLDRLGKHYNKVWNKERRDKAAALGLSPSDVQIICSIVEEETTKADEKGRIGRLYANRLLRGMKLQADPTVRYALNDFTIKRVTSRHTSTPSPYNTYYVKGLPPTPIRTVPVSTIDALLDSSPSDDLYMCAKEDFSGYHNFSATYEEHMENARRYQQALDKIGLTLPRTEP